MVVQVILAMRRPLVAQAAVVTMATNLEPQAYQDKAIQEVVAMLRLDQGLGLVVVVGLAPQGLMAFTLEPELAVMVTLQAFQDLL